MLQRVALLNSMTTINKLDEYRNYINSLRSISSYEVYRWMIGLGRKLNADPLGEDRRTPNNRVTSCQAELYVDLEHGQFKAWSNTSITSGYAYLLTDIFNHASSSEQKQMTPAYF